MVLPKTAKNPTNALHKKPARRARRRERVVEQQIAGLEVIDGAAVVYQLERVRCGKPRCKRCSTSVGHGPYWYAYWRAKKRTSSIYIGKQLRSVQEALDQRKGK